MSPFTFQIDPDLTEGVHRLAPLLGISFGEGITVRAEKSDRTGLSLLSGQAVIYYTEKHLFYRELGILAEHAGDSCFEAWEDGFFTGISVMLDASRCAVPTVKTVCNLLDYLVLMGYGMAMLYTEDTVELPSRPYFGYMRGRYTHEELREIDDYAHAYGIELIPCIECFGHMEKYLLWREAAPIRDTERVLLAREDATFAFLDELIGTVSSCFRSRRIHIGMDEALDMGLGQFLSRHGYVPPLTIFNEYMGRLTGILEKHGLHPMMWSDMYFRASNKHNAYWEKDIEIPAETVAAIPENMDLVYWHYGEKPGCDGYMLEKHKALSRRTVYAGGMWSWCGHFPEHHLTADSMREGLTACRENGVRDAMMTLWLNDNAECDWYTNLPGLSLFAELCYDADATAEKIKARFEAVCGGDYDTFLAMAGYHNRFTGDEVYANFHDRFFGKPLFWQDIMAGLYDANLAARPMSGHYAALADTMKAAPTDRFRYLYDYAYRVFDYLAAKTAIAEALVPAFQRDDRETLHKIAEECLPALIEKTKAVHRAHRDLWFAHNKLQGWAGLDVRYGGVVTRCETAILLLTRYLAGDTAAAEELGVTRLPKPLNGFVRYGAVSTVNNNI